jgi:hypothetical protein
MIGEGIVIIMGILGRQGIAPHIFKEPKECPKHDVYLTVCEPLIERLV